MGLVVLSQVVESTSDNVVDPPIKVAVIPGIIQAVGVGLIMEDQVKVCYASSRGTGAEVRHKVLSILVCEEVNPAISGACFSSFLCGAEGGKVIPELEKKGPLGVGVGGTGTIRREVF